MKANVQGVTGCRSTQCSIDQLPLELWFLSFLKDGVSAVTTIMLLPSAHVCLEENITGAFLRKDAFCGIFSSGSLIVVRLQELMRKLSFL